MPNGTYGGVRGGVKTPPTRFYTHTLPQSTVHTLAREGVSAASVMARSTKGRYRITGLRRIFADAMARCCVRVVFVFDYLGAARRRPGWSTKMISQDLRVLAIAELVNR